MVVHEKAALLGGVEWEEENNWETKTERSQRGRGPSTKPRVRSTTMLGLAAVTATLLLLLLLSGAHVRCLLHEHRHQDTATHHQQQSAGAAVQLPTDGPSGGVEVVGSGPLGSSRVVGLGRRQSSASATATATSTAATATGSVLVDFQVHQPVLTPEGATLDSGVSNGEAGEVANSCQVLLMDHVFAYSYGEPYIGTSRSPSPLQTSAGLVTCC